MITFRKDLKEPYTNLLYITLLQTNLKHCRSMFYNQIVSEVNYNSPVFCVLKIKKYNWIVMLFESLRSNYTIIFSSDGCLDFLILPYAVLIFSEYQRLIDHRPTLFPVLFRVNSKEVIGLYLGQCQMSE